MINHKSEDIGRHVYKPNCFPIGFPQIKHMEYESSRPNHVLRSLIPKLLSEVLFRTVILTAILLMHLHMQPAAYITQEEFRYKCPRRDSFVPAWLVIIVIIIIPMLIFVVPITFDYMDVVRSLLAWTLALFLNAALTEALKVTVKRPRPDFFYRCFPDGLITEDLTCTGDVRDVIDGRKSFPSGHSSFSFCSLAFLSIWLRERLSGRWWLSILPIGSASVIAATRCFDNHHHWEDVVFGAFLGFIIACVCYKCYDRRDRYLDVSIRLNELADGSHFHAF